MMQNPDGNKADYIILHEHDSRLYNAFVPGPLLQLVA